MSRPANQGADLPHADGATDPDRSSLVLVALILVAAVANLNLSVANVALPSIGRAFDSSQTSLNLVAVGYSLGLAASVLWLGALGDRFGRKAMLVTGVVISVPASILAAAAPNTEVLVAARLLGGLSAGMAYPTTLALISVLWAGESRTHAIALWSGIGGAVSALGPLAAGAFMERFFWGSAFLFTLPLAVLALVMAVVFVPAHVSESTAPVDNLGGALSVVLVGAGVLAINFAPVPGAGRVALGLGGLAVVAGVAFVRRQRRIPEPLYDLAVAGRRTFWVAAVAGTIVFGSLMGALFVGQQFLQNVLDYSPLASGVAILPAVVFMVVVAPRSAVLVEKRGSRFTLLVGYLACLVAFVSMLVLWREDVGVWAVGLTYALMGIGVGFAGTPASRALTSSVPMRRAGMASGTADLQRDLGGAIMQSVLGALLTAGYAASFAAAVAASPEADQVTDEVQAQLTQSFSSATAVGDRYSQYASEIDQAARAAFLDGSDWAFAVGIFAIALGAALVAVAFPRHDDEVALLERYRFEDEAAEQAGSEATAGESADADGTVAEPKGGVDGGMA